MNKNYLKRERPPNKKRSFQKQLNNLPQSFNQNKIMKNLSLIICFLCFTFIKAQQDQQTNQNINTEFKTKMDVLFGQLEKNRVPHGILLDFGMEFTNVNAYNGTITDSTYTDAFRLKQMALVYNCVDNSI